MADRNSTPPAGVSPFLLSDPFPAALPGPLQHVVGPVELIADARHLRRQGGKS